MKKALPLLILSVVCAVFGLRYFHRSSSLSDARFEGESGGLAEIYQAMPRKVFPAADGPWVDTGSYRGKVVLLNIWATWCQPCREEIPDLIKLQERFASREFTIVGFAIEGGDPGAVRNFVQNERFQVGTSSRLMNYPILIGSEGAAREFGFEGELPVSFLVTREGKEVKIIRGNVASEEVSKAIERLL